MARLFSPRPPPSEDLFYETYYSLSQQYPLLLLLLVIVLFGLLALLAVAWASGRVSRGGRGFWCGVPPLGRLEGYCLEDIFGDETCGIFFLMCSLCWDPGNKCWTLLGTVQ